MVLLSLCSTLAYLKRGEDALNGIENAKTACFQSIFSNLTRSCDDFVPHSSAHNVLALYLTNCYREYAGLLPIICAAQLTVNSPQNYVMRCLRQISKLDNSETVLYLFALQTDRVVDSCFYLNFYQFQQYQRQASADLLASAQQAQSKISTANYLQAELHVGMQENAQITREISDFLKMNYAQQILYLQNSNSLLKYIVTSSQRSSEHLEAFYKAYENVSNAYLAQQGKMVAQMVDIGVALDQAVGDVASIALQAYNARQSAELIAEKFGQFVETQNVLQENVERINNLTATIEQRLTYQSGSITQNQKALEEQVGQIKREIGGFKKMLENANSKFSLFGILAKMPSGFLNFHVAVFFAIITADILLNVQISKRIAVVLAVNEVVLGNVVKAACKLLYCGAFIPLYCHLSKGQLVQLNKTHLLESGSYSVYLYLKLFKTVENATCDDVVQNLGVSFSTRWLVYAYRTLELVFLIRALVAYIKQHGVPASFYKTFFTPNATRVKGQ